MGRVRLGVACLVPDPEAIEIDGLRRALSPGPRRIAPHITLVPPINVNTERLDEALDAVRRAAAGVWPLRLTLGPAATFWPSTPVVYLTVGGDVDALDRVRRELAAGPFARPPDRPFVPHVTLAEGLAPSRIEAATAALAEYGAAVTVERVHVLRESDGREWVNMTDFPFAPPRIVGRGGLPVELSVSETVSGRPAPCPFEVVARREGAVVGTARGFTGTDVWLDELIVEAVHRGHGIGTLLLREVELLGARRGCAVARAIVADAGWLVSRGWNHDGGLLPVSRALQR